MSKLKPLDNNKHVDSVTIGEVKEMIKQAELEGWESEDGFLLALGLMY